MYTIYKNLHQVHDSLAARPSGDAGAAWRGREGRPSPPVPRRVLDADADGLEHRRHGPPAATPLAHAPPGPSAGRAARRVAVAPPRAQALAVPRPAAPDTRLQTLLPARRGRRPRRRARRPRHQRVRRERGSARQLQAHLQRTRRRCRVKPAHPHALPPRPTPPRPSIHAKNATTRSPRRRRDGHAPAHWTPATPLDADDGPQRHPCHQTPHHRLSSKPSPANNQPSHALNHSINQSLNHSINQSVSHSRVRSINHTSPFLNPPFFPPSVPPSTQSTPCRSAPVALIRPSATTVWRDLHQRTSKKIKIHTHKKSTNREKKPIEQRNQDNFHEVLTIVIYINYKCCLKL